MHCRSSNKVGRLTAAWRKPGEPLLVSWRSRSDLPSSRQNFARIERESAATDQAKRGAGGIAGSGGAFDRRPPREAGLLLLLLLLLVIIIITHHNE